MRLSRYFLPVAKETPADAQIVSHKLMLRAGLIRQTAPDLSCLDADRATASSGKTAGAPRKSRQGRR